MGTGKRRVTRNVPGKLLRGFWYPCLGVLLYSYLSATVSAGVESGPVQLGPRLTKTLDAVAQAYQAGDLVAASKALLPVINRLGDKPLAAFNEALAERRLPTAGQLLARARMTLDRRRRASKLPKPTLREEMLVLAALQRQVDESLGRAEKTTADIAALVEPELLGDYEERLRILRREASRLKSARRAAAFAAKFAREIPQAVRDNLQGAERELVLGSNQKRVKQVARAARNVLELELEVRIKRLAQGHEVLKRPQLTEERFLAAYTTGLDARVLLAHLQPPPADEQAEAAAEIQPAQTLVAPPFRRAALKRPHLVDDITAQLNEAEQLAGDLAEKARWFFEGLEWWLRGRFGWGPDVGGLAKSAKALKSPSQLLALSMPFELPAVTSPINFVRVRPVHIDRRHHYTWAWEDRKLVRDGWYVKGNRRPYKFGEEDRTLGAEHRWVGNHFEGFHKNGQPNFFMSETRRLRTTQVTYVPPQDPRLVYRLVGFVEYSKAIELLEKFIKKASPEELQFAEEMVREDEAFLIYTNLSRVIEGPSLLSEQSENPRDDFARRGLEWVLALARVEVGAMLAGFTSVQKPFHTMAPKPKSPRLRKPYGQEAFREVLTDGLRVHYWTLKNDPAVRSYHKTGVPENHLLTYGRRLTVAQHFLQAARKYSLALLSKAQLAELAQWEGELAKVHRMLLYCLSLKVGEDSFELRSWFTRFKNTGGGNTRGGSLRRKRSRNPLTDQLLLIDPTLIACPCQ